MTHPNPSSSPTHPTCVEDLRRTAPSEEKPGTREPGDGTQSTSPSTVAALTTAVSGGAQKSPRDASSSLTPSAAETRLHVATATTNAPATISKPTTGTLPANPSVTAPQDMAAEAGADIFACLTKRNMNIATASWKPLTPIDPAGDMALSEEARKRKLNRRTRYQKEHARGVFKKLARKYITLLTRAGNEAERQCIQRGHHLLLCIFQALAQRLNIRFRNWEPFPVAAPVPTCEEVDKVVDQLTPLHRFIFFHAEASAAQGASAVHVTSAGAQGASAVQEASAVQKASAVQEASTVQGASAAENRTSLQAAHRKLAMTVAKQPAKMRVRLAQVPFTPTAAVELAGVDETDVVDMISTVPPPPSSTSTPSHLRQGINDTARNLAGAAAETASDETTSASLAESSAASAPALFAPVLETTPGDTLFYGACSAEADGSDFHYPDTPDDKDGASESNSACGHAEVQPDQAEGDDQRENKDAADKTLTTSAGQPTATSGTSKQIELIVVSDDDDDDDDDVVLSGERDADSDVELQLLQLVYPESMQQSESGYVPQFTDIIIFQGHVSGAAAAVVLQPGKAGAAAALRTSTPPLYATAEPALQATPAAYQTPGRPYKETTPHRLLAQTLLHRNMKRSMSHRSGSWAMNTLGAATKRARHQIQVAAHHEHIDVDDDDSTHIAGH